MTDAPGGHRQPVTHGGWVGYASSRPELSPRETSVAALVASGNTNAQIARLLGLSPQSVKNILNHIFAKLGITNRTQLALYMLRRHTDEKAINRRLLEYVAR